MKRIIFFLLPLTFFFSTISAQSNKHSWRTELGSAFTGSGDLNGYSINNEYSRHFSDKFRTAIGIGIADFQAERENGILLTDASSQSLELTAYYTPFTSNLFNLEIGVGGFGRNWNWLYATDETTSFVGDGFEVAPASFLTRSVQSVGYTLSLGATMKITENFGFNLRGVVQNDTNGDNLVSGRLGFNIGF